MLHSFCQTIHPATTVEHSIKCNFYNSDETNLVVAGANQLTIFRIEAKLLEFCQSFELYGYVASLQKITLNSKRDSLVLSFHDAKLSIVEYNTETHDLKTISMHYFEDEDLRDGRVTNHLFAPIVRVDPEDRCIAMLVYGRHIVILPIDKEEGDLEHELYDSPSPSSPGSSIGLNNHINSNHVDHVQKPTTGQVVPLRPTPSSFKSPLLPSYKLDLTEEFCGEKIDNIVDLQFLHNYNDPTLVILHEPIRTWAGRVAMRQDTFAIVALSMNLSQRLQPIIWSVNNLPFDCLKILPVPKPIGGLLVVACNELIYLNQSVPAFGMAFNTFSKDGSSFPLHEAKSESGDKVDYINISLDLSQSVFLSHNKILLILKDGDIFLVTLFNDDMRSIKNFNFERVGSTVQPNCLTLCDDNLLFIGSHVGDSVLAEIVGDLKSVENLDAYEDETDSMISTEEKEPISIYEHDQLLSTSSSGCICYGEATNLSDGLRNNHNDPNLELVLASGHHKNGSICVLQRTIKPLIDDTYELNSCSELWGVYPSKWASGESFRLFLNRNKDTMVFSTIGELKELPRSETDNSYRTNEPSIFVGNICSCNLTIQVMPRLIRLLSNDKIVSSLEPDDEIYDVTLADAHMIALTRSGHVLHIEVLKTTTSEMVDEMRYYLVCRPVGPLTDSKIICVSLYQDTSGLFTCDSASNHVQDQQMVDEIDYDDDEDDQAIQGAMEASKQPLFLLLVDERGVLEIFSMPDFSLVYLVDNFPSAPAVISDNLKLFITDLDTSLHKTKEILMCSMGRNQKRPLLFVRSEMELVIYEVYKFSAIEVANHLKIRFKKLHTLLLDTVVPEEYQQQKMIDLPRSREDGELSSPSRKHHKMSKHDKLPSLRDRWLQRRHWFREFHNVANYRGVFLAGFRPHWFIMTDRCELRCHPMNIEGAIYAFSQYDKDNFIYFNEQRELRIARLPSELNLDSHWPVRKRNIRETVHFVSYHVDRKVYCVVTSKPAPCLKIMRVGSEPDSMKVDDLERECGYIPPMIEKFMLRLYDSETWAEIPDCEIEFDEWEQVTCVKNVSLASEGTQSGLKGFLAISTNYCYGEDVPNRGRIWILDLIEVVPEPDRPLTKNKIKKVYCQEQKGPVTTLSHTCGLLMSAVGQKIYLWQLKEEQLDGVAFIDTQIYIHCAASIKNLILVSDVCKSVSLLRYQQETRTLSMVCRDPRPLEVYACDFVIDDESLTFIVADSEKNIFIFAHEPKSEESHGGTRLVRRADFHLGAHIISFSRIRGRVPSVFSDDKNEVFYCKRKQLTMYSTVDGGIGFVFPISESIHQQFFLLQNEMALALPHAAGLNPKAWRYMRQSRPSLTTPCRGVIDGDMINRFLMLSSKERNDLTRKIGTTTEKILADIQIIQESSMYF